MQIAIIYDVAFPYSIGGGEKINWEIGRRLALRGHSVTLLSPKMWPGEAILERDGMRYVGTCRWLNARNNLGNRSPLQPFLFATSLVGHLAKNGYDLLACNAFPYVSVFAARLAALPRRMPIVLTWYEARGLDAWRKYAGPLYAPPAAALEALTARMSRYHTTISDFTAERMTAKLGIPRDRISMIPCGVDVREVNAGSQPPREKAILYVGRLVRHKRVDHLITAFAEATRDRPDHELRIVGPGAERESLEALAAASGVGERVKFLGTLTGEPMSEQYRRAQVFVLPSDQEGFGMVLLEAMAAGTPVIAKIAEHSAAKTVVHHEVNGLLFATKDELVAQLQRILGDEELRQRLAKNGLATANAHDWDSSIVPAYEEYFRKILDAGKSRGNNLNSA